MSDGAKDNPVSRAAAAAAMECWRDDVRRAGAMDAITAGLRAAESEITRIASEESGLTAAELAPEFARMWRTMAMFADEVRRGAWRDVTADLACANPADAIGPNHDVRQRRIGLAGTVVVFGASNFPLAYGVLGGDTASALAAGCGVVVKEHPAHPRTGTLLLSVAHAALAAVGQSRELINSRGVVGVGFTGSRRVGESVAAIGAARTPAVPVFAEMGSVNPIVVMARAWERRGAAIMEQIADSLLMRHGQQCTAPGMLLLPSRAAAEEAFAMLAQRMASVASRRMLSVAVAKGYEKRVEEVGGLPIVLKRSPWQRSSDGLTSAACVMLADAAPLAEHETVWEEIFGPAMVLSWYSSAPHAIDPLHGALTATLHADADDAEAPIVLDAMCQRAGRVIVNGVPTGVRVCTSMVHAGPWPSTNRPEATAVGPHAMLRWTRPVSMQNWPEAWLPTALRSGLPTGVKR